jgi:hypothetical protein
LESLNYPFVVNSSVTVAQIFQVLPIAISYALQIPVSDVVVRSLQPYPMSTYTATVALLWVPEDEVNTLQVELLATNSRLYNQQDPTAQQLVELIDPTIPLLSGTSSTTSATTSSGAPSSNSDSDSSSNSQDLSGSLDSGNSNTDSSSDDSTSSSSTSSTAKQVGIGIAAASGAIFYSALMFFGAKRFRRQSAEAQTERGHRRVSSITGERTDSPAASSLPFAVQQSYRSSKASSGRAVRPQNISAPLMTENSLLL